MFAALDVHGSIVLAETYYSIGGGFVVTAAERQAPTMAASGLAQWPYPFDSAASMLAMSRETGLSVAAMKRENEIAVLPAPEVERGLAHIWSVMNTSIDRAWRGTASCLEDCTCDGGRGESISSFLPNGWAIRASRTPRRIG